MELPSTQVVAQLTLPQAQKDTCPLESCMGPRWVLWVVTHNDAQKDFLPLSVSFGCVSVSTQVSCKSKVVQILYFKRTNGGLVTEVYVQHFIKYDINNSTLKHFPDFLVCNKGIIFICCPYCLVLSRERRGYKFWEGRDRSLRPFLCSRLPWALPSPQNSAGKQVGAHPALISTPSPGVILPSPGDSISWGDGKRGEFYLVFCSNHSPNHFVSALALLSS